MPADKILSSHESESPKLSDSIGVIGAGMAGTTCARCLQQAGFNVTLFDKGRSPGGRMATRREDRFEFDHGAQYFTARHAAFRLHVSRWRLDGIVAPWPARAWRFGPSSHTHSSREHRWYVGVPSMSAILRHDQADITVHHDVHAMSLSRDSRGWSFVDTTWSVHGPFRFLVFAIPAPQAHHLLNPILPETASPLTAVEFDPCWAAMLVFDQPTNAPFDAAVVEHGPLAWVARNSSKPIRDAQETQETWVLHAATPWTVEHLENDREHVAAELAGAFRSLLDSPIQPIHQSAHRWRYARASKPLGRPFILDPANGVGICGDWCIAGRMEAAFDSGMSLAHAMINSTRANDIVSSRSSAIDTPLP